MKMAIRRKEISWNNVTLNEVSKYKYIVTSMCQSVRCRLTNQLFQQALFKIEKIDLN